MEIGYKVKNSPMGAGEITGFSQRGFPQVAHVTVAWLELENGDIFDPYDVMNKQVENKRVLLCCADCSCEEAMQPCEACPNRAVQERRRT